jgi:hypothetical protein
MNALGLLVHGPEVIDEGNAEDAIGRLKAAGFEVEAALGGIAGKTAVIDAGLREIIDISKDLRPSEVVADCLQRGRDFIVAVNHAKSAESGCALGAGILINFLKRGRAKEDISFVQLEYSSGIIIPWLIKPGHAWIYRKLRDAFSTFREKAPYELEARCSRDSNVVQRVIRGVQPGEKIVVDGVVIGTVSAENVESRITLVAREGKLIEIVGGTLIEHNLWKLPPLDLENELIKTAGVVRRTKPRRTASGVGAQEEEKRKKKRVACFFYTVETLFPKLIDPDAAVEVAVTIGDDTTSIAGDILKRFGVCMIGITDGDADGLIIGIESGSLDEYANFLPPSSIVIRLKPERDDVVGQLVKERIFGGREEIELEDEPGQRVEELKERILELARDDIIGILSSAPEPGK